MIPALHAFLITVVFWSSIVGGAITPRWVLMTVSLYFLTLPALAFLGYVFAVLDFDASVKWALVTGAFCWGSRTDENITRTVVKAFAYGIGVSSVLAILQYYDFGGIPQTATGAPSGLFVNKNFMGEAAAIAAIVALRHRAWPALACCIPALVLSTCRSAWLAVAVFTLVEFRFRPWVYVTAAAIGIVVLINLPGLLGHDSMMQRLTLWAEAVRYLAWFGAGAPVEFLHNEFIQLPLELGVGCVVPFAIFYLTASRDLAFAVGVALLCTFGFPLHVPATAWLIAFMCGSVLGNLRHDERDPLRSARHGDGAEMVPLLRA